MAAAMIIANHRHNANPCFAIVPCSTPTHTHCSCGIGAFASMFACHTTLTEFVVGQFPKHPLTKMVCIMLDARREVYTDQLFIRLIHEFAFIAGVDIRRNIVIQDIFGGIVEFTDVASPELCILTTNDYSEGIDHEKIQAISSENAIIFDAGIMYPYLDRPQHPINSVNDIPNLELIFNGIRFKCQGYILGTGTHYVYVLNTQFGKCVIDDLNQAPVYASRITGIPTYCVFTRI